MELVHDFTVPVSADQACDLLVSGGDTTLKGATATAYTLVATSKGAQVGDKAGNTACDTLTINKADTKTPAACW